jgi:hypothetical protein
MQFFFRNLAALDASKRLSELGYLCEVATILRSAVEQFALCAKLWSLSGSENLQSIRAIQSLNEFKKYAPSVGRLYGTLSKYTHFEYDHHTHFFIHSPKQISTIQRGSVLRAYATHLIFLTMACITGYVQKISKTQFHHLPISVQELASFIKLVDRYSDDVCLMLKHDTVLARMDMLLQDMINPASKNDTSRQE